MNNNIINYNYFCRESISTLLSTLNFHCVMGSVFIYIIKFIVEINTVL